MIKSKIENYPFIRDFIWYFLGSFVPLLIGFIKTPIFTRHFSKEDYGFLGIVSITFGYFGMILFSSISSCLWRYHSKYKSNNSLTKLYSNLAFLYSLASIVLLFITVIWYSLANTFLTKELIIYCFFQILFNQLFLLYMVITRLEGKAAFYTTFQSIRAFLGVVLALALVFGLNFNISALVLSLVLIDFLAIVVLAIINPAQIKLSVNLIEKKNLKELINYGSLGLVINLSILMISSSDRYIIYLFGNLDQVGVFDQVYKLSQLLVVSLVTIFFNTIAPNLLKELEHNFNNSNALIKSYMNAFFMFGVPFVFYLSLFSKDISNIFLGKDFRDAYNIMPLVFLAAFLHGVSNFYELKLKFSNGLKKLSTIVIGAAVFNILLNLVCVKIYGYKSAAMTTMITYVVIVAILSYSDKSLMRSSKTPFVKIALLLSVQGIVYFALISLYEPNVFIKILLGILLVSIYYLTFKKHLIRINLTI